MAKDPPSRQNSLRRKFEFSLRGLKRGIRGESNFFVHLFAAVAVVAAGLVLQVDRLEWCLLVAAIAAVLAAEMFNTAIERLARAITDHHHPLVGQGLDISSAAVLLAALGAAGVAALVFLPRLIHWGGS